MQHIDRNHPLRKLKLSASALALSLLLISCGGTNNATAPQEPMQQVYTHFSDQTELFVEFAPLVSGGKSTFAAHFTRLSDYKPVTEGTVDVILSGGGSPTEKFRVSKPRSPGIFAPTVVPRASGKRNLTFVLTAGNVVSQHDLGLVTVYPDAKAALAAKDAPGSAEGDIAYLKEQQWTNEFAVEQVQVSQVRESVTSTATIKASGEGSAEVVAGSSGTLRARGRFPALGDNVVRGQVLAMLVPRLAVGTDLATLQAELATARSQAMLAATEAARMSRLFAQQAVSKRRVEEAQSALQIARAQQAAAQQRLSQQAGGGGGIPLRAPISGKISLAPLANGASVNEGETVFHVVDRRELWVEAHVPEADSARLQRPNGISFELPGINETVNVIAGENGRLVGVGSMIDPNTRSVPVVFAISQPDQRIVLNQTVNARILTGATRPAITVPVSAVIDDAGQRLVYVMRNGESFARVPVKIGVRDGDRYEITDGLSNGDHIVSKGAMLVRLAAATPEAMGHGHAH